MRTCHRCCTNAGKKTLPGQKQINEEFFAQETLISFSHVRFPGMVFLVRSNNMAREYSLAANQVPVGHNRVRGLTPEKFVALMIKRKSWNLEILARASYHLPVVEPSVGTFGVNSCANVRQPALICSQTVRLWFSTFQQFEISGKVWKYEDLNQRLERFVWEGKLVGKKTTVG